MKLMATYSCHFRRKALYAALLSLAVTANALAAPIISDGFDYPGGGAALHGNNGGAGWSDAWSVTVSAGLTGGTTVETGSLSLGTYATSGNRLRVTATASTTPGSNKYVSFIRTAGADVGVVGGEMWQSFLWRRIDDTFNGFDTVNNVGDGVQDDLRIRTNFEMRIRPKRQNTDGPQVRYQSHELGEELTNPLINDGETFLFVTRWEDLGNTDPIEGPARKAQLWVLDAAGYDAVAGGSTLYDEAVQINNAIHGGTDVTMLDAGDSIGMAHLYKDRAAVLSQPFTTEWDEMRYGDSIDDILPGFTTANIGTAASPGDFDADGDVDGSDFLLWQRGGSPVPLSATDLADWEANFGTSAPLITASIAVPEPSTCVLAGLVGLVFAGRRRKI